MGSQTTVNDHGWANISPHEYLIVESGSISRRSKRAVAVALCMLCFAAVAGATTRVIFHAALLRSTPAAKSHLTVPPPAIKLVFSEQVVPELSRISIAGSRTAPLALKLASDPHDSRTLVGQIDVPLKSGTYEVTWRVVAADGHPNGGSYEFTLSVRGDTATAPVISPAKTGAASAKPFSAAADTAHTEPQTMSPVERPVPVVASLLRGLGLGGLMLGVGLLLFGVTSEAHRQLVPQRIVTPAIVLGALLLVAHMILWMRHVSPSGQLSGSIASAIMGSTVGRTELVRTALAVLALLAILLARHQRLALGFGVACLLISGAIGHPAAIDPYWAVPAKALHLLAGAVWLGGLVWLVWLARSDEAASRSEARRVSAAALVAVIVIALSGLLQAFVFLNTVGDLLHTTYGQLVVAKMIGLAILIGFGAYNRFGLLPSLDASTGTDRLSRSVKWEIAVVAVLILIGGFLAYVPTPPIPVTS
ncbi:MAG TPA: copper resistance protein CopC [Gemmatimonadaceae bacterium]